MMIGMGTPSSHKSMDRISSPYRGQLSRLFLNFFPTAFDILSGSVHGVAAGGEACGDQRHDHEELTAFHGVSLKSVDVPIVSKPRA